MTKVFIVVEREDYHGDTILRVFAKRDDAVDYIQELEKDDEDMSFFPNYDIREKEVY